MCPKCRGWTWGHEGGRGAWFEKRLGGEQGDVRGEEQGADPGDDGGLLGWSGF